MPIRKDNLHRYPKNWKQISLRIRKRSKGRCEFMDPLGSKKRCKARQGKLHPITKSKVVLTVAHLNHKPEDCRDENLKAGCQRCHNRYDSKNRVQGIKDRKVQKRKKENCSLKGWK